MSNSTLNAKIIRESIVISTPMTEFLEYPNSVEELVKDIVPDDSWTIMGFHEKIADNHEDDTMEFIFARNVEERDENS